MILRLRDTCRRPAHLPFPDLVPGSEFRKRPVRRAAQSVAVVPTRASFVAKLVKAEFNGQGGA